MKRPANNEMINVLREDPNNPNCPEFSGAMYGTIQNPDDLNTNSCGDDGRLDEDCLISVTAICGPQKCLENPHGPGCQNMDFNSSHFTFEDIGGLTFQDFDDCKRNGRCDGLVSFLADADSEI